MTRQRSLVRLLVWPPILVFMSVLIKPACGVNATFVLDSDSELTVKATTKVSVFTFMDSDTQTLGGTLDTKIDLATTGALPADFPMLGDLTILGSAIAPQAPFDLSLGNLFGRVNVLVSGAVTDITTPAPPVTLTRTNDTGVVYRFDASNFDVTLNQGTVNVSGLVTNNIDLAATPVTGQAAPGTFGELDLTVTGSTSASVAIDAVLTFPIDFTEVLDLDGQVVTLDVTGSAIANSSFTLPTVILGDFDANRAVDGADFLIWQRSYPDPSLALADWQDNYGTQPPLTAQTVPEPATGWLLWFAALASSSVRVRLLEKRGA